MRRWMLLLMMAAGGLAGCGAPSQEDLALATDHAVLSTQIVEARATATYLRDRLQITVEYVQTAVTQVALNNQVLAATLQAAGVDAAAIAQVRPVAFDTPTPSPQPPPAPGTAVLIATAPGTLVSPNVIVPTPTAGQPTLYNAVMAAEVGENDCALAAISNFPASAERIYVVATAANIAPGTVLGSVWSRDGTTLVTHEFTPDFTIVQNCVWFFVDPTDFPFTIGSYSVQLTVGGQPSGAPTAFAITG